MDGFMKWVTFVALVLMFSRYMGALDIWAEEQHKKKEKK